MAELIDGKEVAEDVVARVKGLTADLTAKIIDGKAIAAEFRNECAVRVDRLKERGVLPGLAVVIVGEDPASQVYVASKSKKAKECGFLSVQHTLPADTSEADPGEFSASRESDLNHVRIGDERYEIPDAVILGG